MITVANYGGVGAHVEGGWMMKGDFPFTCGFRILGEEGVLEWSSRAGVNIEEREKVNPLIIYKNGETKKEIEVRGEDPYYLELKYFIDCIESGEPINRGTSEQAILALQLALAARSSAEKGEAVRFK
jgi:predicted dehydrogenase